jgi:hypothetical protein
MEYTKPAIAASADAVAAIQGIDKGDEDFTDAVQPNPKVSVNAYEADE